MADNKEDSENFGEEAGVHYAPKTVSVEPNLPSNYLKEPVKPKIDQDLMRRLAGAGVKIGGGDKDKGRS